MLKLITAALAACLSLACLPDKLSADFAIFRVDPGGGVTAAVNGSPIILPEGFGLTWTNRAGPDGRTSFVLTSHMAAPNSYSGVWTGGLVDGWSGWNGLVGYFSSVTYPGGTSEPYPHGLVLDGYVMAALEGEPVTFRDDAGVTVVTIGRPPGLSVQSVFDFLDAYFAGGPVADFNHSGALTVQDVFDFLAWWSGG